MAVYDVLIIGGGPAGLTSAIYASRGGLKVAVLETGTPGGQVTQTHAIENYPGFITLSGYDLGEKMREQAEYCGAEIIYDKAVSVSLLGKVKTVATEYSGSLEAKTVILAMGARPKRLGIPKEQELIGRGVSYCATCDGAFYKGKIVAVNGGGNTAVTDAIYLAKFAKVVYIIHRRDTFRASDVLVKRMQELGIKPILNSAVSALIGAPLDTLTVKNLQTGEETPLKVNGLFVAIGTEPGSDIVENVVAMEDGYILADSEMRTNIEGVYAAGDIIKKPLRQVVTACADGAIAGESAIKYLS